MPNSASGGAFVSKAAWLRSPATRGCQHHGYLNVIARGIKSVGHLSQSTQSGRYESTPATACKTTGDPSVSGDYWARALRLVAGKHCATGWVCTPEKSPLLATEAGVGVPQRKKDVRGCGDMIICTNGQLQNAGQIIAAAKLKSTHKNRCPEYGHGHTGNRHHSHARGDISNSGVVAAQKQHGIERHRRWRLRHQHQWFSRGSWRSNRWHSRHLG